MAGNKDSIKDIYILAFFLTAIVLIGVTIFSGVSAIVPVLILAVIEITFSFENAVINSQVLAKMSQYWQTIFLTVGIALAVFGVRFLLPLLMVSTTGGHSLGTVFDLALHNPAQYAHELEESYPLIAAFGGVFLLMLGLRFFGEKKDVYWLNTVEARIGEFNQHWWVVISGAMASISLIYFVLAPRQSAIVIAAILGAITFLVIKGIGELLVKGSLGDSKGIAHGKAAFTHFIYLELLDASFSFDGVLGAFAITKDVLLITAGLGIGAFYVRSMTIHLLRHNTLAHYRYLVHGAHYAIFSLALVLILGIRFELPKVMTGLIGLVFIGTAIWSSIRYNRSVAA